jgi:YfiH family protein
MPLAEFLTSPLLSRAGFCHAFFTRRGGVSEGPYASLNFSVNVGDEPECVQRNLELAAEALSVKMEKIFFLSQVHGADVVELVGDESREAVLHRTGDAIWGRARDVAHCVRTADCVPVLIADRKTGAVAAVHAGWRGTVAGVVKATVDVLRENAAGADLIAAIGPHISLDAFEVSEDVAETLERASPEPGVTRQRPGEKPHVDLRKLLRAQLVTLGLPNDAVDDVTGCTVLEPERFFSFRRDGRESGRLLSAIVPRAG